MAGPFVSYAPSSDGRTILFSTKDGKQVSLFGPAAEAQMQRIDALNAFRRPTELGGAPEDFIRSNAGQPAAQGNAHPDYNPNPYRSVEQFDRMSTGGAAQKTDASEAFGRGAIAAGLNTAALPVTLAGRAAEAAGYPNAAAHLNADEALGDAEWIRRKVEPAEYKKHLEQLRKEHPTATALGQTAGELVGSAPLLMAGGAAGHALEHATHGAGALGKAAAKAAAVSGEGALGGAAAGPATGQTKAYLRGEDMSNEEVLHDMGHHAKIGAVLGSAAGTAGVASGLTKGAIGEAGEIGTLGAEAEDVARATSRVKNVAEPSVSTELKLQPEAPGHVAVHAPEATHQQPELTLAQKYQMHKNEIQQWIDQHAQEAFTARMR